MREPKSQFIAERFALREIDRGGHRVRVFQDNLACLAEVHDALADFAEREFLVQGETRLTFAACRRLAAGLAHRLQTRYDLQAGDRVGLALANSPEWVIAFIAVSALGAVPVLVNPRAGPEEFEHCLASVSCRACLHDRDGGMPAGITGLRLQALRELLDETAAEPLPRVESAPEAEALLMFTSGTTGLPKAASLSHQGLLTALKTIQYSGALIAGQLAAEHGLELETLMKLRPVPVNLLVFPLFHVSGCHAIFLTSLLQGGKVVILPRWDVQKALEIMERERVTAFPAVPTMFRDLLAFAHREQYDLASLTSLSVGGQATPPDLLAEIRTAFPSATLGTGYGMTECNGTVTLSVGRDFTDRPTSAGRLVPTFDGEVRDENGRVLGPNETGELHVRGAALMSGYANTDTSPFDENGWFATGDIGYLDDEARLHIVERKTDMVISGGENIYCAEVERVLERHPLVREAAAVGLPDTRLGERLVAVAVTERESGLEEDELGRHCLALLARHKLPKELQLRTSALPRNAAGKLLKSAVRDEFLRAAGERNPSGQNG